ncbi:LuxR C-terminal-related transcriptional regulator [Gordonia sp. (in: high G+C Gram-positive bacteria)]|uniref:LuxR C-terminal-related transcriptional regulator n=1 Tax=Gordonia sp. (in: high G+C Gram-positive bacteria) TaxID=84139 RepID=UPI00169CE808|nr:LuxR C-terminal-related transcriptional regulator [Gordonia sp. (in: high G+C Gram-positive bacteria)]NLG48427.1 GAF domain-containing protein [Gordonia sp. (in: high G+C Gram-positive bacteria)]
MGERSLTVPVTESLRRIRQTSGVPLAFAGMVEGNARVTLDHFVGNATGSLDGLAVEVGHGLGGKVLHHNRPMAVNDYLETPQITHRYNDAIATEGIRGIAAAPVIVDSRMVAVLYGALRCDTKIDGRLLDVLTAQARNLEQEIAVSRALVEADARLAPEADALRDRMTIAYTKLRALARELGDDAMAGEIARITDVLLDGQAQQAENLMVQLTGREQDVLALAALGYSNPRIAAELGVAVDTVKGYMKAAMGKLDARTRLEAVVLARRLGALPT